jgi:RNA polymerase sigma factor (sigma-70 family)
MSQTAVSYYPNMLLRGPSSQSRFPSCVNPVKGGERGKSETMLEEPRKTLINSGNLDTPSEGAVPLEAHQEDVQLVNRAQAGDPKAFDALVLKHTSKLYGLVYHMTSNHDDTNDLLQDIWTKVYRSLAGFRGASRFTTWLHSIAVNMSINFVKRRARRRALSFEEAAPGEVGEIGPAEVLLVSPHTPRSEASLGELQQRLSEALEQLTPDHRAVVTMFDIQGMAHAEISKILGVSEGTVRSRLFYAHRQLQSYLSDFHTQMTDK